MQRVTRVLKLFKDGSRGERHADPRASSEDEAPSPCIKAGKRAVVVVVKGDLSLQLGGCEKKNGRARLESA